MKTSGLDDERVDEAGGGEKDSSGSIGVIAAETTPPLVEKSCGPKFKVDGPTMSTRECVEGAFNGESSRRSDSDIEGWHEQYSTTIEGWHEQYNDRGETDGEFVGY